MSHALFNKSASVDIPYPIRAIFKSQSDAGLWPARQPRALLLGCEINLCKTAKIPSTYWHLAFLQTAFQIVSCYQQPELEWYLLHLTHSKVLQPQTLVSTQTPVTWIAPFPKLTVLSFCNTIRLRLVCRWHSLLHFHLSEVISLSDILFFLIWVKLFGC